MNEEPRPADTHAVSATLFLLLLPPPYATIIFCRRSMTRKASRLKTRTHNALARSARRCLQPICFVPPQAVPHARALTRTAKASVAARSDSERALEAMGMGETGGAPLKTTVEFFGERSCGGANGMHAGVETLPSAAYEAFCEGCAWE